jgi:DNA-binding response OmpR family regulator
MKSEIAYLDDSPQNLECIDLLLRDDFVTSTFMRSEDLIDSFSKRYYSAILLDIHMPQMDGFEVYEKVVQLPTYNGCPILFISSDTSSEARMRSLELGAVDFIDRMTSPEEIVARIKSKIQFFKKHRSVIEFGALKINLTLLKTYLGSVEIPLTFIELKILCRLLRCYPGPVMRDALVETVWRGVHVLDATIHTHVFNLNTKLSAWDHEIQVQKNVGVLLTAKEGTT